MTSKGLLPTEYGQSPTSSQGCSHSAADSHILVPMPTAAEATTNDLETKMLFNVCPLEGQFDAAIIREVYTLSFLLF